jgi:flagellar biosynthesis/type III secretory pathway protein FliH
MSYESPINIYQDLANEIAEMHDNTVYMKIREIVDVDKEELLKALAYDRDQYDKGYTDGYRRGLEEGKQTAMIALANSILQKWGDENEDEPL